MIRGVYRMGRLAAGLPRRMARYKRMRCMPLWVTYDITWNCNCRCAYCNYWKEKHAETSTDDVRKILSNLRRLGVAYLGISGGEPLLRADIVDIVAYAKTQGMYVGLNTNGTIWNETTMRNLMESGLDTICFSIDGARPETHERFRDRCPFERVVAGIRKTVALRDENGFRTQVSTNTVVHRGNVGELKAIADFRRTLGVDRNNFQPVVTAHIQDQGQRRLIGFSDEDRGLLDEVRETLREIPGGNLAGFANLLTDFYTGGAASRSLECYAGRAFAYVDPRGVLYPCSVLSRPLADLTRDGVEQSVATDASLETLRHAADRKCAGCSLVCYMERNVLLNNVASPRMWWEAIFKRYQGAMPFGDSLRKLRRKRRQRNADPERTP